MKLRAALAVAVLGTACSSPDEPPRGLRLEFFVDCPELPDDGTHQVVLVHDVGIDPRLPVFQGKIAGCYTVVCDGTDHPLGTALDKEQILAATKVKDTRCRVRKGITVVRSNTFDELGDVREDWNRWVFAKRNLAEHPSATDVARLLSGEGTFNYHGSATASAIAFDNPDVRLVLVDSPSAIARPGTPPWCPSVSQVALEIAALSDPEVRSALASAPIPSSTEELVALYRRHRVTIINESFGRYPTAEWERACPGRDVRRLSELYALEAAERRAFLATSLYAGLEILTIKSAGNYGLPLDGDRDSLSCIAPGASLGDLSADLVVGAYGFEGTSAPTRSTFTNTGACVDVYAPGEEVIGGAPEQWYAPWNGTSLAAPLVTRWLSKTKPRSEGPKALRDAALALRGVDGMLPMDLFDPRMLGQATTAPLLQYKHSAIEAPYRSY